MTEEILNNTHFEFPEIVGLMDKISSLAKKVDGLVTENGFFVYPDEETDLEYSAIYHRIDELASELLDTDVEDIKCHTIETLRHYGYRVTPEEKTITCKRGIFSYF